MDWMALVQWGLPSGFVCALVSWFAGRKRSKIEDNRSANDAYENLLDTLNRQSDDIQKLYNELGYIRRAIEKRNVCRYLANCPVDVELRRAKGYHANNPKPRDRQREGADHYNCDSGEGSRVSGIPPPNGEGGDGIAAQDDVSGTKRSGCHQGRVSR
ncbi:MAG: hypothetical protein RSA53_05490 [Odoribacter sp.]